MNIYCLNKISAVGTGRFGASYEMVDSIDQADGVLVRSASMHETQLPENLLSIARAGAGTNNIPIDRCTAQGIVVFNTPGANANAVKELVIAGLLMTSRRIYSGICWAQTLKGSGDEIEKLVEKGKSQFVGPEIKGKTLGVIGLGAIGILVANAAQNLGMNVYGYDPYLSVDAAWSLSRSIHHALTLDEIFACDYITIHIPLTADTKNTINAEAIAKMPDGVRILNFARGGLVDSEALAQALNSGKVAAYATDFPDETLLAAKNVLPFPHLGASTPESEDNCAVMAADQTMDYLENGNIKNSVNLPSVSMPRYGDTRFCLIHKNVPNTIGAFAGVMGDCNINIENMQSKSRKDYAYTILDVSGGDVQKAVAELNELPAIVRVRVI